MNELTCFATGHSEITTTLNFSAQTPKGLCPWADLAPGPNKVKEGVAQKLHIFPCLICLLVFCFP